MPTATADVDVLTIHSLSVRLDISSERLRRAIRGDADLRRYFANAAGRWLTSSAHVEDIRRHLALSQRAPGVASGTPGRGNPSPDC